MAGCRHPAVTPSAFNELLRRRAATAVVKLSTLAYRGGLDGDLTGATRGVAEAFGARPQVSE